jgi:hypothetical protein
LAAAGEGSGVAEAGVCCAQALREMQNANTIQ